VRPDLLPAATAHSPPHHSPILPICPFWLGYFHFFFSNTCPSRNRTRGCVWATVAMWNRGPPMHRRSSLLHPSRKTNHRRPPPFPLPPLPLLSSPPQQAEGLPLGPATWNSSPENTCIVAPARRRTFIQCAIWVGDSWELWAAALWLPPPPTHPPFHVIRYTAILPVLGMLPKPPAAASLKTCCLLCSRCQARLHPIPPTPV
jgi:hypothetical protein